MSKQRILGNNKFYSGKFKGFQKTRGWFVGSFMDNNSPLYTKQIEVAFMEQKQGDSSEKHYHKEKVELIIVLSGKALYVVNDNEVILKSGDFLFVDTCNVISAKFLKPTKLFAVHSPSIPADKYLP